MYIKIYDNIKIQAKDGKYIIFPYSYLPALTIKNTDTNAKSTSVMEQLQDQKVMAFEFS